MLERHLVQHKAPYLSMSAGSLLHRAVAIAINFYLSLKGTIGQAVTMLWTINRDVPFL